MGSTDPDYQAYNVAISGIALAIVGGIGLVGNMLVVIVYLSAEQRRYSMSIYLAALACSDFSMILTAMFLFVRWGGRLICKNFHAKKLSINNRIEPKNSSS